MHQDLTPERCKHISQHFWVQQATSGHCSSLQNASQRLTNPTLNGWLGTEFGFQSVQQPEVWCAEQSMPCVVSLTFQLDFDCNDIVQLSFQNGS